MIRHWGVKTAQGRYWDNKMDEKALSHWIYGFLRNETRNPDMAMRVLLQVITHIHRQYYDLENRGPDPLYILRDRGRGLASVEENTTAGTPQKLA